MNVFGLEPDAFQKAEKFVDLILSKPTATTRIRALRDYIHFILYGHTCVTLEHKTVLFLLNKEGLHVNQHHWHEPVFFQCGQINREFNEYPLPHTLDLLHFLVDHCDMNVHIRDHFNISYIYSVVKSLIYPTEKKVITEILGFILEKGDWIQYQTQIKQAIYCFIWHSVTYYRFFSKTILMMLLSHSSESIVQQAFQDALQSLSNNDIHFDYQNMKFYTTLFRYGYLLEDENKQVFNIFQEVEILIFYSLFY